MKRLLMNAIFMMILFLPITTLTSGKPSAFEQQRKENITQKTGTKILTSQSCDQSICQSQLSRKNALVKNGSQIPSKRKPFTNVILGDAQHPSTLLGNQVPVIQISTSQSPSTDLKNIINKTTLHALEFTELGKTLEKKLETSFTKIYNDTPNEHKPFYYQFLIKRGYIVDNHCAQIDSELTSLNNSPNVATHSFSPQNQLIK